MKLYELLQTMKINQVARADFGGDHWYITKTNAQQFRYCADESGTPVGELVVLTYSETNAEFTIVKQ